MKIRPKWKGLGEYEEIYTLKSTDREVQTMKTNPMLAAIEAKYNRLFHLKMDMLMQMGQDAAMIAAHDVLQMGPGRAKDFCVSYIETMNGMARMVVDDQRDDKEFVYAKAKIDEQIKAIVGPDNFQPWEVRYGGDTNGL